MLVMQGAILREMLDAKTDADGVFEEFCVKLFQNDMTPTRASLLADFTAATFTGYAAPATCTWGTVFSNLEGNAEVIGSEVQFNQTGVVITNTIYGYYVTDTAGTKLLAAERFTTPVVMDAAAKAIIIIPRLVESLP